MSTLRAMPSVSAISSNRRRPLNASRRISTVQRSPTSSSDFATEQF